MDSVDQVLDRMFLDVPQADIYKPVILGMATILGAKETLEALYGLKAGDKDFIADVKAFFDHHLSILTLDQKTTYEDTMSKAYKRIFAQLIEKLMLSLPMESVEKLKQNIQNLNKEENA